jgi:tetratricopeptide (TPR) repeat protein
LAKLWRAARWFLDRAITAAPNDWQLYAARARAEEEQGQAAERDADLARAVEHGADADLLLPLAAACAGRGEWDKAAAACSRAAERGPCPFFTWEFQALVYSKAGDRKAYQRLCAGLGEGVLELPYPPVVIAAVRVCGLAPGAVGDYRVLAALAEEAARTAPPEMRPAAHRALGAILYRAGRWKEAVERLNESAGVRQGGAAAEDWLFLAMAHFRLGDKALAREELGRAGQATLRESNLWEKATVELLSQEARVLVEGAKSAP